MILPVLYQEALWCWGGREGRVAQFIPSEEGRWDHAITWLFGNHRIKRREFEQQCCPTPLLITKLKVFPPCMCVFVCVAKQSKVCHSFEMKWAALTKKNDKKVALWEPRSRTHFLLGLSHTDRHTQWHETEQQSGDKNRMCTGSWRDYPRLNTGVVPNPHSSVPHSFPEWHQAVCFTLLT